MEELKVIRKASRKYKAQEVDTLETARDKWQKGLERATEFVNCTSVESELALQLLLAHDPLSTYWKGAVLPDGFIAHIQLLGTSAGTIGLFDDSKFRDSTSWMPRPDQLVFIKDTWVGWMKLVEVCMIDAGAGACALPSGRAWHIRSAGRAYSNFSVHYKFHPKTHEIVADRIVVVRDED